MNTLTVVSAPGHARHYVRETGYVESPRRLDALKKGISGLGQVRMLAPAKFADRHVTAVHEPRLVRFVRSSCEAVAPGKFEYPYMIPVRNSDKPPADWSLAIGYYCIDTFTPIHRHAWATAREAVDAALTAARELTRGVRHAYALVRPPGHHAERAVFGGFCYLNSSAIAAHYLSAFGKVAMLDVDYHHGNGQQDIFWSRRDVLTVSLHADPRVAYPYFSGYANETGEGRGKGFNVNFPLPEKLDGSEYRKALKRAIALIKEFEPQYLVVPLGLDPGENDPTGSWTLKAGDFYENGRMIAALNRPALFVQEGGYRIGTLAPNIRAFFRGVLGT